MAATIPKNNYDGLLKSIQQGIDGVFRKGVKWGRYLEQQQQRLATNKNDGYKWISVKDRLPEDNQIVAFVPTCNQGSIYTGQFAFIGRSGGVMFTHREGRGRTNYYAKFWMPLPEPPKENTEVKKDEKDRQSEI